MSWTVSLDRALGRRGARAARVAVMLTVLVTATMAHGAAVAVSPVAVYIGSRDRTGMLTLFNPGSRPEEIQVDFGYGYPTSDSDGNVSVPVVPADSVPAGEPSAVSWLRAFPRRLVLEPGQRQVMRIMVQPPAGLPDGEYWARALVRSRGGQPPIEQQRGDVTVQVEVETVVVVAVNYRNGSVDTGLRVADASATTVGDTVRATIDYERTGNAAYLGRVLAELVDAGGRTVASTEEVLAVYKTIRRRLDLVPPPDAAGPFKVRFTMDTNRDDLPPGGALPSERVIREVDVR